VKCVQALLLADEDAAARELCTYALQAQAPDGHFETEPGDATVMLHPLLYAVEGLWMAGVRLEEPALLQAARRATTWVWQHQLPTGGLPRSVDRAGLGPEQFDLTSQAVRAAILLGADPDGLDRAISRLADSARPDAGFGSALVYQPEAGAIHLNSWVTMFGGQALRLAAEGPESIRWDTLV
jgi:hypothetical protein